MTAFTLSRRLFVLGAPAALAGCVSTRPGPVAVIDRRRNADAEYEAMYGELTNEPYPVPAIEPGTIDPIYQRQLVNYPARYQPGTIVVDPENKFLYLVRGGGQAMRYGIGVGREGFGWSGNARVGRKAMWPTWTPPSQMIQRQPELQKYAGGMPPGIENPLGARALYLYQGNRDTLYRLHGTNDPESIGTAVSSGCIRLVNQDIIDLFSRAPVNTPVVVLANGNGPEPGYDPIVGDNSAFIE